MLCPKWVFPLLLVLLPLCADARPWKISLPVQGSTSQALSPDGQRLAVAPTFGPVAVFSTESGHLESTFK
ncbi:MAG TPA: hypothetical protein VFF03_17725, partial [Rhodocyclaceae bacterium]|nr:hypothetical protein [Rhodocyclaceae bacterium]